MASEELQHALRRVSATSLDSQGAANVWAGTTGLSLLAALNAKAGNAPGSYKPLLAVCNQLAGTPTASNDIAACAALFV
jgi:hypothetical protein